MKQKHNGTIKEAKTTIIFYSNIPNRLLTGTHYSLASA